MTLIPNGYRRHAALVTGGAGFIGSHVTDALLAQGWDVHVLDNLSAGSASNVHRDARLHIGDVCSEADLRKVFRSADVRAVIHCAAQASVYRSMIEPEMDFAVNVGGTKRLLAMAKEYGARRFVFMSSGGAIYGETPSPATERTLPAPRSVYGFHKYAAEQIVRAEGVSHAILRPSNVYGARQRADAEGGVVAIFTSRQLIGRPIAIHGTGQQVRDFVHVSDVVSATLAAAACEEDAVWNVASGRPITVLGLAEEIAAITCQPLRLERLPHRSGDVERSLLDASLLSGTGRWGPPVPLADGLRLTMAEAARRLAHRLPESIGAAGGA
jgi:UDP-glucose 4-epimerase